jgi:hypothetical protein
MGPFELENFLSSPSSSIYKIQNMSKANHPFFSKSKPTYDYGPGRKWAQKQVSSLESGGMMDVDQIAYGSFRNGR